MRFAVTSGRFGTRLRYSVAGMPAHDALLPRHHPAESVIFGDAGLDLGRVLIFRESMTRAQLDLLFDAPPAAQSRCTADSNGDGRIDLQDFASFLEAFRALRVDADLNEDHRIDWQDVQFFSALLREEYR